METSIHQEVAFQASPARIYAALLDEQQFAAITGASARIQRDVGGAFELFGGRVTGRIVELVPDQRIVQAWRVGAWPPGVYSLVRFEAVANGPDTRLILDHTGFPAEDREQLNGNWPRMYWAPLQRYLAA